MITITFSSESKGRSFSTEHREGDMIKASGSVERFLTEAKEDTEEFNAQHGTDWKVETVVFQ